MSEPCEIYKTSNSALEKGDYENTIKNLYYPSVNYKAFKKIIDKNL